MARRPGREEGNVACQGYVVLSPTSYCRLRHGDTIGSAACVSLSTTGRTTHTISNKQLPKLYDLPLANFRHIVCSHFEIPIMSQPSAGRARAFDKRAKFVELAERRTVNAIRAIRVIGKLGNPFAYEYDEADIKKIVSALTKEVEDVRLRMMKKGSKAAVEFKL
jgi:hypothetical protein